MEVKDREEALAIVKENGGLLEYLDFKYRSDREIVLEAVKSSGMALEFAYPVLQEDKEIALEALKHGDVEPFIFIGNGLKREDSFLKEVYEICGEDFIKTFPEYKPLIEKILKAELETLKKDAVAKEDESKELDGKIKEKVKNIERVGKGIKENTNDKSGPDGH
ncbi:MAG: DUF4116 domain-containing protein [Clostridiales bacterium]|nr:DUF4116 domain-containing protein [Clostridiales bacterium]